MLLSALVVLLLAMNVASSIYMLIAVSRVRAFGKRRLGLNASGVLPPVTVLKPICGLEAELRANLLSFCRQDYADYQIVFGVRDSNDPAVTVIERLIAEHPDRDICLIIDDQTSGSNPKVSNLQNMYRAAKHSILVIADSDMRVDANYLSTIVASFQDETVGAVTCLYRARSDGRMSSLLGRLFINEWFLPSVLVSVALRDLRFCLGATMAVRRRALESIGGFPALANYLADDHMLGRLVSQQGLKIVLSTYVVDNIVYEKNFRELFLHEVRWARTVRGVEPWGHAFSFIMYVIPIALATAVIIHFTFEWYLLETGLIVSALSLRILMHCTVRKVLGTSDWYDAFLLPVRDVLNLLVWLSSYFTQQVWWKDRYLPVHPSGRIGRLNEA